MNIKVGEKYRIKTDRYNWMFQEHKGLDKHGKDVWDTWGYWGTIEQLARCLPDHILRRLDGSVSEAMPEYQNTVQTLVGAVESAQRLIQEKLA